jgi:hypothetical protein
LFALSYLIVSFRLYGPFYLLSFDHDHDPGKAALNAKPLLQFCIFRSAGTNVGAANQGCQMEYFKSKNPNLGNFWRVLQWTRMVYFMDIWSILQPFGILNGHLVYFVAVWYIFPRFGM